MVHTKKKMSFEISGRMKKINLFVALLILQSIAIAQHSEEGYYVPETDTLVLAKLKAWQDLKFGLLMHWGPYSQWGIVESWSLCPEEYGWCERKAGSNPDNYFAYKQEYEALKNTFNPVKFDPDKWAKAAKEAGMKYVVFTTKHHDGFTMFDSEYTDYKITDPGCQFSTNPKANVTKEIFNSFRNEGLWTGAYYSKPDWHSEFYWDPYYPPKDRNVNYDPEENPDKWNDFINFTHNQILELMTDYGNVDILWLDGGWVAKKPKSVIENAYAAMIEESSTGYVKNRIVSQDIQMDELIEKVRKKQPGLIVVDRAVQGKNQNYLTPENRVPAVTLPYPWESCIISGGGWSYTPNAKYMTGREGIHLLIDVVAKGGNLLLNIAPSPEGEWQDGAYDLLKEYENWMNINSEGIYESQPLAPFKSDNICMTQLRDGTSYFFYLADENENTIPEEIYIAAHQPSKNAIVTILGSSKKLKWSISNEGFKVKIPKALRDNPPCEYAWTIKVSKLNN